MANIYSTLTVCQARSEALYIPERAHLIFITTLREEAEAQIHDVIATMTLFPRAISEERQMMLVPLSR